MADGRDVEALGDDLEILPPTPICLVDNTESLVTAPRRAWASSCRVLAPGANAQGTVHYLCVVSVVFPERSEINVRKRYSEFVSLREALKKEKRDHNMPKLPPKGFAIDGDDATFIERRRVGLELFLSSVVLNPEVADARALRDWFGV